VKSIVVHVRQGVPTLRALVDDEDYEWLNGYRWFLQNGYAARQIQRQGKNRKFYMHREILGLRRGEDRVQRQADHINGEKLDNRRSNLRIVTREHNIANQRARKGRRGVHWDEDRELWIASARFRSTNHHLGRFDSPDLADAVVTGFWRGIDAALGEESHESAA
jgi:hypothetical protein